MKSATDEKLIERPPGQERRRASGGPTPEQRALICEAIVRGNHNKTAAILAGIAETTFYDWQRKGRADTENHVESDYAEFVSEVALANAQLQNRIIERINNAVDVDPKNWAAGMTLLERRFPSEFGKRTEVHHSGTISDGVDREALIEELRSGIARISERIRPGLPAPGDDERGTAGDHERLGVLGEAEPVGPGGDVVDLGRDGGTGIWEDPDGRGVGPPAD